MYAYIARRLLATLPVMTVVALFVFLLLRLTAGDPAAIIAGDNATSAQVAQIRARLGLDRPIPQQFVIWLGQILRGDLGESWLFAIIEADLKSFHTRLICAFVGCVHFADHTPSVGST